MKTPYLVETINSYGAELTMLFLCSADEILEISNFFKGKYLTIKFEYSQLSREEYKMLEIKKLPPRFILPFEEKIEFIINHLQNARHQPNTYRPPVEN